MEYFAQSTDNPHQGLVIKTDGRWKKFKYGYEVPKKVMSGQFDYLKDGEETDGFFKFLNTWYHTSEFLTSQGSGLEKEWDGIKNESHSDGVLLKISKDGEEYKVGRYYVASKDHWDEQQAKKMHPNATTEMAAVMRAVQEEEAADRPGALLSIKNVRRRAGLPKEEFDAAALELQSQGRLVLHYHDFPASLSSADRDAMVRDSRGNYYIGVARGMNANPEDEEHPHPHVVINGKEVPIVNPNEYDYRDWVYLFSFGAYGDKLLLVFGKGVESALEVAADYMKTVAPGVFVSQEELKNLYEEVLAEGKSEEEAQEAATVDLTYTEAGYIPSWEWTVDDAPPEILEAAKAASKTFMEDPDEPFMRMNGQKVALVSKSGDIKAIYDDAVDAATDRGGSDVVVWLIHDHRVGDRIEFDEKYNEAHLEPNSRHAGYRFRMAYDIVTPESAEDGDTAENGWEVEESEVYRGLQDLLKEVSDHTWVEWSSTAVNTAHDWITSEGEEDFGTGDTKSYSLWISRVDGKPLSKREFDYINENLPVVYGSNARFQKNGSPNCPKDLTRLTARQHQEMIQGLSKRPLNELRRRQDLIVKQQQVANERGNTEALQNLAVMESHVTEAIMQKEFKGNASAKGDLSTIKALFRQPDTLALWGIPHELRPGQSPKDLHARYRSDWIFLGYPGWYGNMPESRIVEIKQFLATQRDNIPMNPYEWSIV
jgi:hypothetical protein